jgi:hypothetical protein
MEHSRDTQDRVLDAMLGDTQVDSDPDEDADDFDDVDTREIDIDPVGLLSRKQAEPLAAVARPCSETSAHAELRGTEWLGPCHR